MPKHPRLAEETEVTLTEGKTHLSHVYRLGEPGQDPALPVHGNCQSLETLPCPLEGSRPLPVWAPHRPAPETLPAWSAEGGLPTCSLVLVLRHPQTSAPAAQRQGREARKLITVYVKSENKVTQQPKTTRQHSVCEPVPRVAVSTRRLEGEPQTETGMGVGWGQGEGAALSRNTTERERRRAPLSLRGLGTPSAPCVLKGAGGPGSEDGAGKTSADEVPGLRGPQPPPRLPPSCTSRATALPTSTQGGPDTCTPEPGPSPSPSIMS